MPPLTISPPPWACVPAGPGYMCTYPGAALNPGDSIDMVLTTTVPKADLKAAGKCSVMNDVAISKAPGGSALNIDPSDDTASAEADAVTQASQCLEIARRASHPISFAFTDVDDGHVDFFLAARI